MDVPTTKATVAVDSIDKLKYFVETAQPGDVCLYHTGNLLADRDVEFAGDKQAAQAIHRLGSAAMAFAKERMIYLIQRRVSPNFCDYLGVRSHHPARR